MKLKKEKEKKTCRKGKKKEKYKMTRKEPKIGME